MNSSSTEFDPYNFDPPFDRTGLWFFYFISNYWGSLLCIFMIYYIYKNPERNSEDVFTAGLGTSCIGLGLSCGTQCAINMIAGYFYGSNAACKAEALMHIVSILSQFFNVCAVSVTMYLSAVKGKKILQKTALKVTTLIWVLCLIIIGLGSLISRLYMVSNYSFCFYRFNSFNILFLLIPGLVVSLSIMSFCHYKIWKKFKSMLASNNIKGEIKILGDGKKQRKITKCKLMLLQIQSKSFLLLATLLIAWFFAIPSTIVELSGHTASSLLVTGVGVGGVSGNWAFPLVYAYTTPGFRDFLINIFLKVFCCGRIKLEFAKDFLNLSKRSSTTPSELTSQPSKHISISAERKTLEVNNDNNRKGSTDPNNTLLTVKVEEHKRDSLTPDKDLADNSPSLGPVASSLSENNYISECEPAKEGEVV